MKKHFLLISLLVIFFIYKTTYSNILHVPPDYSTIQAALNSANYGDTVLVQPGTYYENITWPGVHGIKLISAGNASNTIIDGNGTGRVLTFPSNHYYDSTTIIKGFTLTNGHVNASSAGGGGIYMTDANPALINIIITANKITGGGWAFGAGMYLDNSSPLMRNVQITYNESSGDRTYGGGMHCTDGSNPVLENVIISGNQLKSNYWCHGGGLYCNRNSNPILNKVYITNNFLDHNASWYYGGGIFCLDNSSPVLVNVLIANQVMGNGGSWYKGGAIYCKDNANVSMTNVTLAENKRENLSSIDGSGIYAENSSLTMVNTISWNNNPSSEINLVSSTVTASYCDIRNGYAGTGNINTNPLFVSSTDFHLQSLSPCVNAGTLTGAPAEDIEGNPRPVGFSPDIGAYEYQNCNNTYSAITITACDIYTVPSGDETYTSSGSYSDTIPNAAGCDSIITINLTVIIVDTSVTQILNSLVAHAKGASFQWLDCDNGYIPISGETDSIFTPASSGNYAVEITQNICIDTSACYNVIVSSTTEEDFQNNISVCPNPTSGQIFISFNKVYEELEVKVLNSCGQVVEETHAISTSEINLDIDERSGLYIILIKNNEGQQSMLKVVKR